MFGLWDPYSNTFIRICLFSIFGSRHYIWNLYTCCRASLFTIIYLLYLSIVTGGKGQRLNKPKGMFRCSDRCQVLSNFLCEDGDIIYLDGGVTDCWGHWVTPERVCQQTVRGDGVRKNMSKRGVGHLQAVSEVCGIFFLVTLQDGKINNNLISFENL